MESIAVELSIFGALVLLGLTAGQITERRHLRSLAQRALQHRDFLVTDLRSFPMADPERPEAQLIVSEVVIGSDYLKSFLASLRNLFGGEVKSFQKLLQRARREALLRAIEQARSLGYNALGNLRLDPADVGGNTTQRRIPMAAIIASATAYHARRRGEGAP